MSFTEVDYKTTGHVAVVTLNRPESLNAWTSVMGNEVRQAMRKATDDGNVRVIVLTGAGRGFCAGADMKRLSNISSAGRLEEQAPAPFDPNSRKDFQRANTYFPAVPKPIIAAINGPCAGLGLCYALFCDMRFASREASFTTAFARRGLIAEHGMSWTLPRLVGHSAAADLMLSARKFMAPEALELGMVDRALSGRRVDGRNARLREGTRRTVLAALARRHQEAALGHADAVAERGDGSRRPRDGAEPCKRRLQGRRAPFRGEARAGVYGEVVSVIASLRSQ